MEELNWEKLKDCMQKYNQLEIREKREFDKESSKLWNKVIIKYFRVCGEDEILCEADRKMKIYRDALMYDAERHFAPTSYEGDNSKYLSLGVGKYETEKYIRDNFSELCDEVYAKVQKIRSKNFVFRREEKLDFLEKKLEYFKEAKMHYEEHLKKQKHKDSCIQRENELYTQPRKVYYKRLKAHAKQVVAEALDSNPELICEERKIIRIIEGVKYFDMKVLNACINSYRDVVIKEIQTKKPDTSNEGENE